MSLKCKSVLHTGHSIMIEKEGTVRAEINLSNSRAKLFSPLNTLQVQHEWSARVEDLVCYLTLVLGVAGAFFSIKNILFWKIN